MNAVVQQYTSTCIGKASREIKKRLSMSRFVYDCTYDIRLSAVPHKYRRLFAAVFISQCMQNLPPDPSAVDLYEKKIPWDNVIGKTFINAKRR